MIKKNKITIAILMTSIAFAAPVSAQNQAEQGGDESNTKKDTPSKNQESDNDSDKTYDVMVFKGYLKNQIKPILKELNLSIESLSPFAQKAVNRVYINRNETLKGTRKEILSELLQTTQLVLKDRSEHVFTLMIPKGPLPESLEKIAETMGFSIKFEDEKTKEKLSGYQVEKKTAVKGTPETIIADSTKGTGVKIRVERETDSIHLMQKTTEDKESNGDDDAN